MKPQVALIIPIYQVERYLAQCLQSACNQTLRELQIILVDDCGSDNSMAIAREFAAKDPRVTIVSHSHNKGLAAARNTGMAHSGTPYLMFLDSDDWLEPTACEHMLYTIQSTGADLAMCGTELTYEGEWPAKLKQDDAGYYALQFAANPGGGGGGYSRRQMPSCCAAMSALGTKFSSVPLLTDTIFAFPPV